MEKIYLIPVPDRTIFKGWAMPPIGNKWAEHIGYISTIWGAFEGDVDAFTSAFKVASNQTDDRWRRDNYKNRKKEFIKEAEAAFGARPTRRPRGRPPFRSDRSRRKEPCRGL